ncbi:MAG: hypothetical protein IAE94_10675 [Chthoniobacterales bacterium]|nr:hypothetical protein [Chthoniobacterales bacterium]
MIRIELTWLVFVCLLVFLSGIFIVWIGYEVARRRAASRSLAKRLRCRVCSMEFSDASQVVLPACPRCGSLNERRKPPFF